MSEHVLDDEQSPDQVINRVLALAAALPDEEAARVQTVQTIGLALRPFSGMASSADRSIVEGWIARLQPLLTQLTIPDRCTPDTDRIISGIRNRIENNLDSGWLENAEQCVQKGNDSGILLDNDLD